MLLAFLFASITALAQESIVTQMLSVKESKEIAAEQTRVQVSASPSEVCHLIFPKSPVGRTLTEGLTFRVATDPGHLYFKEVPLAELKAQLSVGHGLPPGQFIDSENLEGIKTHQQLKEFLRKKDVIYDNSPYWLTRIAIESFETKRTYVVECRSAQKMTGWQVLTSLDKGGVLALDKRL